MKKLTVLSAIAILFATSLCAQEVFSNVSLKESGSRGLLTFALPSEANVLHYRVEASNDNNNFEVIGTVTAKGNTMLGRVYTYVVYKMGYKCYRIGKVSMGGSVAYSPVINNNQNEVGPMPSGGGLPVVPGAIVGNK